MSTAKGFIKTLLLLRKGTKGIGQWSIQRDSSEPEHKQHRC